MRVSSICNSKKYITDVSHLTFIGLVYTLNNVQRTTFNFDEYPSYVFPNNTQGQQLQSSQEKYYGKQGGVAGKVNT